LVGGVKPSTGRQAAVFGDEFAQPVKDSHDGDVDPDGALAVEDR
jgi:hypothetical protein